MVTQDTQREVTKWVDRVAYDVRFRDDTKANLSILDRAFMASLSSFVYISAERESLVYKICRYFIEKDKAKAADFEILDGDILEAYMADSREEDWKKKNRLDEMFGILGNQYRNKWIVIPLMQFDMNVAMAIYLTHKLRSTGACGVVFCAQGENMLAQILVQSIKDNHVFQFPKAVYRMNRRKIADDEY